MVSKYIQKGDTITLTAPADVVSGAGLLVGSIFAVAATTVLSGASVEGHVVGVFDLAKTGAQAATAGAKLYWDDATKLVTTTAGGNTFIGHAIVAAAGGDATVRTRLIPGGV